MLTVSIMLLSGFGFSLLLGLVNRGLGMERREEGGKEGEGVFLTDAR